jgi:hypothetical protein
VLFRSRPHRGMGWSRTCRLQSCSSQESNLQVLLQPIPLWGRYASTHMFDMRQKPPSQMRSIPLCAKPPPPPPPNVPKCAPQNALDRILTSSDALLHASNAGANPSTMTRSVPAASRLWQNRAQPTPMIAVHVCGAGGTEHQDRGQTPDGGWDGIGKGALGCP